MIKINSAIAVAKAKNISKSLKSNPKQNVHTSIEKNILKDMNGFIQYKMAEKPKLSALPSGQYKAFNNSFFDFFSI